MFGLFAPRKLQNAAAAVIATILVLGAAVTPFTSAQAAVHTELAAR
jgi:hypothetical protein